jgi:hypothetical protein
LNTGPSGLRCAWNKFALAQFKSLRGLSRISIGYIM